LGESDVDYVRQQNEMRVIYTDSAAPNLISLKRLVLLANELAFMDRPSVTFGEQRGTIGMKSPLAGAKEQFKEAGIGLAIYHPPSGAADKLYLPYIDSDYYDLNFRKAVIDGLRLDKKFAETFIQLNAEYAAFSSDPESDKIYKRYKGAKVVEALISDPSLVGVSIDKADPYNYGYHVETPEGRKATLRLLIESISIQATTTMLACSQKEFSPISDSSTFAQLLGLRLSRFSEKEKPPSYSTQLGFKMLQSVLPDEVLENVDISYLLEYRKETIETYKAWSIDLDRLSVQIEKANPEEVKSEMQNILRTEVVPKMIEYKRAMDSVADKMFGTLIKRCATTASAYITASQIVNVGFNQALIAGALSLVPAVVDYLNENEAVRRRYSLAYLIDLSSNVAAKLPKK
jgi:hypothetical protein